MSKKVIALITHDGKKDEIVQWAVANKDKLKNYELCGTGHTAQRVAEAAGLQVTGAEGKIDAIVFLCDPLTAQPHDPDVRALLRIAVVYDVPIATNISTADCIINSLKE